MLPERYWQGRRYCNFPYMWLNLPCSADPRFIRRKRYGQHYSRLLLRLPYHFQGSHVPTRKRRTTGVKGSSLGCDKDLAARKGPRYRPSERIGMLGAVADLELILQSLFRGRIWAKCGHFAWIYAWRRKEAAFIDCMAEGEGFEPPLPFRVKRFSRPPVSTAHTSLRESSSLAL